MDFDEYFKDNCKYSECCTDSETDSGCVGCYIYDSKKAMELAWNAAIESQKGVIEEKTEAIKQYENSIQLLNSELKELKTKGILAQKMDIIVAQRNTIKELKEQISKMKCCDNCKFVKYNWNGTVMCHIGQWPGCSGWQLK